MIHMRSWKTAKDGDTRAHQPGSADSSFQSAPSAEDQTVFVFSAPGSFLPLLWTRFTNGECIWALNQARKLRCSGLQRRRFGRQWRRHGWNCNAMLKGNCWRTDCTTGTPQPEPKSLSIPSTITTARLLLLSEILIRKLSGLFHRCDRLFTTDPTCPRWPDQMDWSETGRPRRPCRPSRRPATAAAL